VLFLDSGHLVLTTVPMPVAVLNEDELDHFILQRNGEE
jgi:hypothetical protein